MTTSLPATLEARVREKIDVALSEFIPPEDLERLVKARVQSIMNNELPALITEQIKAKLIEQIKESLNSPDLRSGWGQYGMETTSKMVEKVIIDSAPLILARITGGITQHVVEQLKYAVQSGTLRF